MKSAKRCLVAGSLRRQARTLACQQTFHPGKQWGWNEVNMSPPSVDLPGKRMGGRPTGFFREEMVSVLTPWTGKETLFLL